MLPSVWVQWLWAIAAVIGFMVFITPMMYWGAAKRWKASLATLCGFIIFAIASSAVFSDTPLSALIQQPTTLAAAKSQGVPSDLTFVLPRENSGQKLRGKTISDVAVCVLETKVMQQAGKKPAVVAPASGNIFIGASVYVANNRQGAITLDGSLFKISASGREYNYHPKATTALALANIKTFAIETLKPGTKSSGWVVFEVPEGLNSATASLLVRNDLVGDTGKLPLQPVVDQGKEPQSRQMQAQAPESSLKGSLFWHELPAVLSHLVGQASVSMSQLANRLIK